MSFKKHFLNLFLAILALGMSAHAKVEFDVRFDQEPVAGAHTSVMMEIYLKGNGEKVNSFGASVTLPEGFSGNTADFVKGSLFNEEYGAGMNSGEYDPFSRTWLITLATQITHFNKAQFIAPAEWTLLCKFPVTFDKGTDQPVATEKLAVGVFDMYVIEEDVKVSFSDFQFPSEVDLVINDSFILAGEPLTQNGTEDFSEVEGYNPLIQGINYAFSGSKVWDKETNAWKEIDGSEILITDLVETDAEGNPMPEEKRIFRIVNNGVDNIELYSVPNVNGQSYLKFSVVSKAYPKATPKTFIMSYVVEPADDPAEITATVGPGTEGQPYSIIVNITDIDSNPLDYLDQGGAYAFYIRINGRDFETKRFEKVLPLTLELAEPLPFDLIANENGQRTATKDMTVQYVSKRLVAPGKGDEMVSPEQTATFTDVDQPVVELNAPTVTISAGPYTTDNAIVIDDFIVDGNFTDADGDEIKPHYYWTKAGEEAAGATIPTSAKKGETWTPHVRVFTKPYGEDVVFKTYDGKAITIVDSPAVKVSSPDSLFIQKGEATTGSWTITFSDADIADGETYSKETIPVPVAKNGTVTVDSVTLNQDYIYTVTYIYKVSDSSKEFREPDAFEITIKSEGGAGFTVPFSVNYMSDPAPVIAVTTEPVLSIAEGDDAVITAEISAADSNTAVTPTGVRSIEWSMTLNEGTSNGALTALDAKAEGFVATEDVTPASSKVTVKVPFNVLSGRDRSATATYTLTATAKDKNASSSKSWVITVHDTDQAPVITEASLANSVEKDKIFTGTDVTVTASGAMDPDFDDIAYYTFNGEKADDSHSIKVTNLVKGDVLGFNLVAYSQPAYSKEGVRNSEGKDFASQITVLNSAPTANTEAKTVETSEVADGTTEVVFELANMAEFKDIDMITVGDKLRDSLTYSVSDPSVAAAGTLAVDAATGAVTYKPAKFYNGSFSFEMTAKDEDNATATATVKVTVKPVNDAPFIVGRDIYHVPSDCDDTAYTATFTVNMGGGEDEKAQTIATATIIEVLNGLDLDLTTETAVTVNNDVEPRTISFQYTLTKDTAEKLGKETVVRLQVKDAPTDGTEAKESAVFEMKIVLGASPWYPTVEAKTFEPADALAADGSKAYMVEIVDADGKLVETIKIADNNVKAADYLDYTDGLLPGKYTYNAYEWNPSIVGEQTIVASAKVSVDDYTQAAKPELTCTDKSANTYELKISAPMASMYRLDITTPSDETITSWGRFMADKDGIIRSEVTLMKSFSEKGEYKVKVAGWNPMMASMKPEELPVSDEKTISIAGEESENPAFPAITDAAYRPVDNKAILIANSKQAVVDFAWPSISTKAEYTLYVYTANGQLVGNKAISTGANAIAAVTLDASQPVNHYMWRVSAKVNGKTVWSDSLAFKLVTSTDAPLVKTVTLQADAEDVLSLDYEVFSDFDNVSYDMMAYDVSAGNWTKMVTVPLTKLEEPGKGELRLPAGTLSGLEDGDYIYLRVKVNGEAISVSFEDFALRAL